MVHVAITGKASISNDGATIMKLLDVVHPAAKTLVEIAKSQDAEVSCSHSTETAFCMHNQVIDVI